MNQMDGRQGILDEVLFDLVEVTPAKLGIWRTRRCCQRKESKWRVEDEGLGGKKPAPLHQRLCQGRRAHLKMRD